jgi:hypothetical protein
MTMTMKRIVRSCIRFVSAAALAASPTRRTRPLKIDTSFEKAVTIASFRVSWRCNWRHQEARRIHLLAEITERMNEGGSEDPPLRDVIEAEGLITAVS